MNEARPMVAPPSEGGGTSEYGYLHLLARVKKALESAREVAVPATDIRRYPNQPREYFDEKHIRGLSESIDAGGQTTTGMIREKLAETRYELIDGECRWQGILLIPESRRPLYKARLIEADDEVVQYLISGIANFNRRGHTAIKTMKTIDRLVSFELPMKEIANLLGISESWAHQMYGLKKLELEVLALLNPKLPKEQQIPVLAAVQISKIEAKFQRGLAERVIRKDITLSRLRGEVVKVAQKEGSPIRTRDVEPRKQWASFGNKIEVITRTAGDAKALIEKDEVSRYVKVHSEEASVLLRKLQETREEIAHIESLIRKARSES